MTEHSWLSRDPEDRTQRTWLFKTAARIPDLPMTEDLVEKNVSELSILVGVPAAKVELATRGDVLGCLVEDLRPSGWEAQPGRVLVDAHVDHYDSRDSEHRGYSVQTINSVLDGVAAPPDFPGPASFRAFDVFTGMLLLDAFVANTDRHDRNWMLLIPPAPDPMMLCGSFDHASSLGFNLTDAKRSARLERGTVALWAKRAPARQFEHIRGEPRRHLLDVASEALELCAAPVLSHWRATFAAFEDDAIASIVSCAPGLTETAQQFTVEVLSTNRRRILDVLDQRR